MIFFDTVIFCPEAEEFMDKLDLKSRNKVYFNWDKEDKKDTLVIATHGIIKKQSKVPKKEIERAKRIRKDYFKAKK